MKKQRIKFAIDTLEDMIFNDHLDGFIDFLKELIGDGYELDFYRIETKKSLTVVKDLQHFENFIKSLNIR